MPYAELYGTHPRFEAATSEGFLHTSDYCDPCTSKSGSVMQVRHAKVNTCHDHAAIHKYRQANLDKIKVIGTHKIACNVGDRQKSDDRSTSNVATGDNNNSKSDDDTPVDIHTNLHVFDRSATCADPHSLSPSSARGASRATALHSVNSALNSVQVSLPDC